MTKKTAIKTKTAAQAFHEELETLKPLLPKDWKIQLIKLLPLYDSYRGGIKIHNVYNGGSTDMAILNALKQIVENNK